MTSPLAKCRPASAVRAVVMSLVVCGLVVIHVSGDDKPAVPETPATPTKAPAALAADAKKSSTEAVNAAVADLTKEALAHKKDPKTPLRQKSNYFVENKSSAVMPEEILIAMNRSLATDGISDSYIKWQLLSGIVGPVDPKLAPRLLSAYQAAALPGVRPGLETASKRQLDQIAQRAGVNGAAKVNEELQKEVEEFKAANEVILMYREAAYAHLPGSAEAILAGLQDGAMRAGRGVDADRHMKGVLAQITTWSVSASPQQIHAVAGLLKEIVVKMAPVTKTAVDLPADNFYADGLDAGGVGANIILAAKSAPPAAQKVTTVPGFPPMYYVSEEFDAKAKKATWKEGAAKFPDAKLLNNDIQVLNETASTLATMKK